MRNHARAMLACDFAVAITVGFRILYVFVVMEIGTRKLLHINATAHPTASWTVQQLREAIPSDHGYRWLIHHRSGIFSEELDRSIEAMGVEVLKTPVGAPKANAHCERLIGSLGRECLDWFLPVGERHLRTLLREWLVHYTTGRPHLSLGPGIPDPPPELRMPLGANGHNRSGGFCIRKRSILGGLHHEYQLEKLAA
ncbi:MAG: transposase [Acidobacteria bacterium]|nr:transposase [Acidobacteriota bacterium]